MNIRNTIYSLLDLDVIPIINENDTTSTEEIRFGDNDKLSAMIANALSAELLILLSDVNGLYTSNPKKSSSARLLTSVSEIDQKIEKYVDQDLSEFGQIHLNLDQHTFQFFDQSLKLMSVTSH